MIIDSLISLFRPLYAKTIVYMLQSTEYNVGPYLRWYWRTNNFSKIMYRRSLIKTRASKVLWAVIAVGMPLQITLSLAMTVMYARNGSTVGILFWIGIFLASPIVWAHAILVPLILGRWLIIEPKYFLAVRRSKQLFAENKALKIAIAGSYGKTTMKEMLLTVLSEGKKVAATPANKNVAISHARFANSLSGDEEVLIIEYGEGAPGDVPKFVRNTKPDIGVITGLAPAHLDKYKTLDKAGEDIFELAKSVGASNVYVNIESDAAKKFTETDYLTYSSKTAAGWKIENLKSGLDGVKFKMSKAGKTLKVQSGLLGLHQVGPIAVVCAIADRVGLSAKQIEEGIKQIQPFEHRMQPRQLMGAWLVDDTYNGNIEGMKAGLNLLSSLKAKRKIYITPGLVDQGAAVSEIHQTLGKYIKEANPEIVILMQNSATDDIVAGMDGYSGQLIIETDPLNFYTNIDKFVASGDLVLMQNDWPDNYK